MILCEAASGRELRRLPHPVAARSIAFAPDGETLAAGLADGTIVLWDPGAGSRRETIASHSVQVTSVAYAPDGLTLASAGRDGNIKLWDLPAPPLTLAHTVDVHTDQVWFATVSPDGRTLATGSGDRTVRLWDRATKQLRKPSRAHCGRGPRPVHG